MLFSNLFVKNVVQDLTSAGIDWQREKWQSGLGSKFIHQGEKNAVKYADEVIVLSKGVQDYFKETYGREKLTTECIENVIMMVPFSSVVMWTFGEKIGNGWKKILWESGKIAFIFSISIEMLQLLLRLGTFQLSDIFYNTVGGVIGGVCYCVAMKARKRL